MKESIFTIEKSPIKYKKYRAIVTEDGDLYRSIDFGDNRYEQYKDSTKLKLYEKQNHGDKKRRRNYFMRHSGVPDKKEALEKEIKKSKIHDYLNNSNYELIWSGIYSHIFRSKS